MKRIIWSAVLALIAFAACIFLPVAALRNLWRITELIELSDVTPVLMQLKDVPLVPGYVPAAVCAALVFAIAYLLRRHKVVAGIIIFFMIVIGVLCALMAVKSNNVPFGTIVRILVEYVRLGAF